MLKCLLLSGRSCIGDGYELQCPSKQASKQASKPERCTFSEKEYRNTDIEAIFSYRICS